MSRYSAVLAHYTPGQSGVFVVPDGANRPQVLRGLRRAAWRRGWVLHIDPDRGRVVRFTVCAVADLPEERQRRLEQTQSKDAARGRHHVPNPRTPRMVLQEAVDDVLAAIKGLIDARPQDDAYGRAMRRLARRIVQGVLPHDL